jgi:tripartite ATP-independent transporter DctM subunit
MSQELITFLMLGSLITLIVMGYPIAFVLGGIATIFGLIFVGPNVVNFFMSRMFGALSDYLLVAIPLFIFMGVIIEKSGLAMRLYDAMHILMGRLRGGLAIATVLTCTVFAAATGLIGASVVTMGLLALPAMMKYKYDKALATGAICAGGTLGILIPPSVLILIYGPTAGISVGKLFAAAVVPGLMLSGMYLIYVTVLCYLKPEKGPALPAEELNVPWTRKLYLLFTSVIPVSALILAVLGSIFFGLATPTEAAGIGAFASLIMAAAYRNLSFENLKDAVYRTMTISAMIFLVLIAAAFFTTVFIRLGGGHVVSNLVLGLPFPDWGILLTMFGIVFLMGMFIDWIGVIMIAVPLFTPIAAKLGYDPVWFAMMVIVVMQTSFLSPPFAYAIFYLKGIAPPEIKTSHIYRGVVPFIIIQLIAVLILGLFPGIILWLPNLM